MTVQRRYAAKLRFSAAISLEMIRSATSLRDVKMTGCMLIPDFCQIPPVRPRLRAIWVASFAAAFYIVVGRETLQTHTEQQRSLQSALSMGNEACPTDAQDARVFNQLPGEGGEKQS